MSAPNDPQIPALAKPVRRAFSPRGVESCRAIGFFLGAGSALFHAITTLTPLPGWELDPFIAAVPHTGLGSGGSMLVDGVMLFGAFVILVGEWARGGRIGLLAIILLFLGAPGVAINGLNDGGEPYIARSWIAAMALGVAMFHLCRDDRYKRMALAVLAGFVIMLAFRGIQQVVIEHPQTMQEYRSNRERFLDAQGWTYDSPMAKSYERRISQNEATGWFGFANVYATFAAGGATAGTVLLASSILTSRRRRLENRSSANMTKTRRSSLFQSWWHVTIPCAGIAALILAGAKGGIAAYLLGLSFAGLTAFLVTRRWSLIDRIGRARIRAILSLGALGATMSLVVVRGLLGTRLGELSILFRWFYLEAAARIGLSNFPYGCGADGFKRMYLLFKNPLSPEEVSSSHNLLADFWACGGVFGVAWIALWLWWIAAAGSQASEPIGASRGEMQENLPDAQHTPRPSAEGLHPSAQTEKSHADIDFRLVAGIGVAATLVALRLETPIMTPDLALTRIACLLAWCGVAWLMISRRAGDSEPLNPRVVRLALSAAAVAMGAHALIDQTGVWPSSAALLMLFIGAAAAGSDRPDISSRRGVKGTGFVVLMLIFLAQPLVNRTTWSVLAWERLMIRAAEAAHPAAEVSNAWQRLNASRTLSKSQAMTEWKELRATLTDLTGRTVKDTPADVEAAVNSVVLDRIQQAIELMTKAQARRPGHQKTQRELSRLELLAGQRLWLAGNPSLAQSHLDRAVSIAVRGLADPNSPATSLSRESTSFGWAAVVHQTRYDLTRNVEELRAAAGLLEQGSKLDPYGLEFPKRLMKLHVALGNTAEATRWARKALEIDELQRLDKQVQGLRESERAEALRLAGNP